MARCFICLIVYFLLLLSKTYGDCTTRRIDDKYEINNHFYVCPTLQGHSKYEWDNLISRKVNMNDFGKLKESVICILKRYECPDYAEFCTLPTLNNRTRLYDSILRLYTGPKFYKFFNNYTKDAIEGKRPFKKYSFPTSYAIIDRAYKQRVENHDGPLYRGINAPFRCSVGQTFRFNHFASMSEDKATSLKFIKKKGTLFELHDGRGIPMSKLSHYSHEKEHLIHPYEEFKVLNISSYKTKSKKEIKWVLIKMKKSTSSNRPQQPRFKKLNNKRG